MVSPRRLLVSSVHRVYMIENTLCVAALVPGMAKENSKMSCFLMKLSLHTNSDISDHLSKVVNDFVFHSSILVLLIFAIGINSYDMQHFLILQKSVAWRKGPRRLLQWIHILFDHTKTFPHAILSLRMYNPWIERNGCVLLSRMQTVLLWLQYVNTHRL
jgi:hypothetical protein